MNSFFSRFYIKDILSICCLVIVGLMVLNGFSNRVDIQLTDDSGYLVLGLRITQGVLVGFGPLYSILFKIIKQLTDDPVSIYDIVMYIMYLLPPLAAYGMMRTVGLKSPLALLLSAGFLFSPNIISFITWSKISHYTITIIMLWVILAIRLKSTFSILLSLVILTFLLGYIRPESHLSWYIASVVFLAYWYWKVPQRFERKQLLKVVPVAGLFFIFIFLTILGNKGIFGLLNTLVNPMAGGRSNIAFAQQFSYNYCEWKGLNNFDWIQWRDYARQSFGDFQTLGEAFKYNPSLFVQHLIYNIQQYIIKFFNGVSSIFFPPSIFKWHSTLSIIFFIFILAGRILYVGTRRWWEGFKLLFNQYRFIILSLVIISIPSVIASVIFYTREHYLLLVMPLVLFFIAIVFMPKKNDKDVTPRIFNKISWIGVVISIFILRPSLSDYKTFDVWEAYSFPSNRATIEAIRKMNIQQEVREVDYEGGLATYLGKNFKWVNTFNKESEPYAEFESQTQPNLYYVTKALLSNQFLTEDPEFMDIIHSPQKHGFHKVELQKGNKGYLLVNDSLRYSPIDF
ncbi:MAG: hypothetical protein LC105_09850 [Chitinophagales bacterium]|nr:hypothetical protein [Chitinophagales bacterium]MCZ2394149.1 hypothetical protein [Chitinophagales bacterium]